MNRRRFVSLSLASAAVPATLSAGLGAATLPAIASAEEMAAPSGGGPIDFTQQPAPGTFPARWIAGSASCMDNQDPPIQVHWYNAHTAVMRENKAYSFEAPFMLLHFGNERILMVDQGFTTLRNQLPLRDTVDACIAEWCRRNKRAADSMELIVAFTHLHTDHFAGQNQFMDRRRTRIMGLSHAEMVGFWGMTHFPEEMVKLDLGGREIWIWGNPGHVLSEFAYYDTYTQILHTGDMFYRGRCYISLWDLWLSSMKRLVAFTEEHPVTHVVGCHVEAGKNGEDYPAGCTWQPNEGTWQLSVQELRDAYKVAQTVRGPGIYFTGSVYLVNESRGFVSPERNPYAYS